MKKRWNDALSISLLCILVGIFFIRLFYPEPHLIVTPDYGRSDAWHFSFPTKFALSQSLQSLSLPLWRNDIGAGFPLFAEGQTGALFIPNLVAFKILPPVPAYNAALAIALATLGIGVYFLCRTLALSILASLIGAMSILFSGLTLTQLPHITLLQGISMLPLIMTASIYFARRPSTRTGGLLALLLSQQIFAGFPQATFLTLVISGCMVLWVSILQKRWQITAAWLLCILLGIGAGAIQIFPSYEFLTAGTDPHGFTPGSATAYSMPLKHLMSFIDPFYFGNPALGTYPPFYAFDGSIFWENTAYMGILPIFLLIGSLFLIKKHTTLAILWGFLILTIMLAAGKYGPTYILYSMWPLSLFRVPSRFLWLSMISISYISGYVITVVQQKKKWHVSIQFILILLLVGHTAQLMGTWWDYHLIEKADLWLTPPKSVEYLKDNRILTLGEPKLHNDVMTTSGWTKPERFNALRMGVSPDTNMLWNISQYHVYAGRFLNRPTITETLLSESIEADRKIATISGVRTLSLFSVNKIASYTPIDSKDLIFEQNIHENGVNLYIYKNTHAVPRAYLVQSATQAATLKDAITILRDTSFIPGNKVLLEEHAMKRHPQFESFLSAESLSSTKGDTIAWLKNSHERIELRVVADTDSILVLADTFYPGWTAAVDTTPTPILAANLSQRAIVVPKGTHTVTFSYSPLSLLYGGVFSGASLVLIVFLMTVPIPFGASHIQKIVLPPASDRRNTRHTS